jgi:BCD family chlorophyll transporter-like MFS transporter
MKQAPMNWIDIVRLGLVQSALGAIVALTTSTLNRVMVVEEAMPAILPAAFVAWHYVVQLSRPRWGYGSDMGHRRTPWIIGGMGVLALGGMVATDATVMISHSPAGDGFASRLRRFLDDRRRRRRRGNVLAGLAGDASRAERRAAAASVAWIMMIAGIVDLGVRRRCAPAALLGAATGDGSVLRLGRRLYSHAARGLENGARQSLSRPVAG